jgi:Type IV secretion system pilin
MKMKKIKIAMIVLAAVVGLMTVMPNYAHASTATDQIQSGVNSVGGDSVSLGSRIGQVVNILLYILGSIAVLMIVIGGIRYTTSNGDSSQIKGAKDTIMYAVVGLVVAIMAYAIVNFVVKAFA